MTATRDAALRPWDVRSSDYPADAAGADRIRFLLRYAILAPSGHNTQPWLFGVADDTVELRADRSRRLPVVDAGDRALIISCGAALETLCVAAARFGHAHRVELLPDAADPDLLALVTISAAASPPEANELFDAIPRRHSNRRPFEDRDLPDDLVERLVADAADLDVELRLVGRAERAPVAELVGDGDRVQMRDARFRRELASWIRPNRSDSPDGMRGYGFGFGDVLSRVGPLLIRTFDLGRKQAAGDRSLVMGSPLVGVFVTATDAPAAWLATGRALQRVLLRARAAGVSASFVNQPVEVAQLRPELAQRIGRAGAWPQLLVRFGYAPDVEPQPRRPVEDVTFRSSESRGNHVRRRVGLVA